MSRTELVPMVGDRWNERVASDEWLRGETWGFLLAEVTGDIDRIRERGWLGVHDATRVVAVARRDRDAGDENDAKTTWWEVDRVAYCDVCVDMIVDGVHVFVRAADGEGRVCLSCAPLPDALAAVKAAVPPPAEISAVDVDLLSAYGPMRWP